MVNIIFEENTDIHEEIYDIIHPNNFVNEMLKIKEIDTIENEYGDNVYKLCRNSIAWIIKQLKHTYYIFDIKIVEGLFNNNDHAWIQIGDYNVDLTLAQFISCPKLSISKITNEKSIGYQRDRTMNI